MRLVEILETSTHLKFKLKPVFTYKRPPNCTRQVRVSGDRSQSGAPTTGPGEVPQVSFRTLRTGSPLVSSGPFVADVGQCPEGDSCPGRPLECHGEPSKGPLRSLRSRVFFLRGGAAVGGYNTTEKPRKYLENNHETPGKRARETYESGNTYENCLENTREILEIPRRRVPGGANRVNVDIRESV